MITNSIKEISNDSFTGLQEQSDVIDQWGSSFGYIQVSAAFVKAANLRKLQPAPAKSVLTQLAGMWDSVLPYAEARQLANVLWACGKLRYADPQLWSSTLAAVQQQLHPGKQEHNSTDIANIMHGLATAAATMRGVPGVSHADLEAQCASLVNACDCS
jgi:hypothetical protein